MFRGRKYSQEFKREAIALARQSGVNCWQIALEIDINPNLLPRWRREADAETDKAFKGAGSPRDEELARQEVRTFGTSISSATGNPESSGARFLSSGARHQVGDGYYGDTHAGRKALSMRGSRPLQQADRWLVHASGIW